MVTHEDVLQIAKLAKLSIREEELDSLTKDMSDIIAFADTINNAVGEEDVDFDNINNLSNAFRDDVVRESFPREEILKNAPFQEDGYFLEKKSLGR